MVAVVLSEVDLNCHVYLQILRIYPQILRIMGDSDVEEDHEGFVEVKAARNGRVCYSQHFPEIHDSTTETRFL